MDQIIIDTQRLYLRKLTPADRPDLCDILQDSQAMYAYEHAFSDEEVDQWLERQLGRYERDGFGLWAAIRREDGAFVGQIGITPQDWDGRQVPEVGYLLKRRFWHRGYCTEGARGCMEYGFNGLGVGELCSIIRENNTPSRAVALRNGMVRRGGFTKHYYGMDMPHDVFSITRAEFLQQNAHQGCERE